MGLVVGADDTVSAKAKIYCGGNARRTDLDWKEHSSKDGKQSYENDPAVLTSHRIILILSHRDVEREESPDEREEDGGEQDDKADPRPRRVCFEE